MARYPDANYVLVLILITLPPLLYAESSVRDIICHHKRPDYYIVPQDCEIILEGNRSQFQSGLLGHMWARHKTCRMSLVTSPAQSAFTEELWTEIKEPLRNSAAVILETCKSLRHGGRGSVHPQDGWPLLLEYINISYNRAYSEPNIGALESLRKTPVAGTFSRLSVATQTKYRQCCTHLGKLQRSLTDEQNKLRKACCAIGLGTSGVGCGIWTLCDRTNTAQGVGFVAAGAAAIYSGVTDYRAVKAKPVEYHIVKHRSNIDNWAMNTSCQAGQRDFLLSGQGQQSNTTPASRLTHNHQHPRNLLPRGVAAAGSNHLDLAMAQGIYQRICATCSTEGPIKTHRKVRCHLLCEAVSVYCKTGTAGEHHSSSPHVQRTARLIRGAARARKYFVKYHCASGTAKNNGYHAPGVGQDRYSEGIEHHVPGKHRRSTDTWPLEGSQHAQLMALTPPLESDTQTMQTVDSYCSGPCRWGSVTTSCQSLESLEEAKIRGGFQYGEDWQSKGDGGKPPLP